MSWETRGNNRYYYRRRKVNGRIVAEYVGGGDVGTIVATLDDLDRHERNRVAAEFRQIVEAERQTAATLAQVNELINSAVAAVLIVNGYHTHKRQWRKAR